MALSLLLISFQKPLTLIMGFVFLIATLIISGADCYLVLRKPYLVIKHLLPPVWGVGIWGSYATSISNQTQRKLNLEFSEDSSERLLKKIPCTRLVINPRDSVEVTVQFLAKVRGDLPLGASYYRHFSPLGFWLLTARVTTKEVLKVYPNISDYIAFDPFQHRRRIFQLGEQKLNLMGEGTDFDSLRAYQPGDDYKKINFKATARIGKPTVSVFRAEQNRDVLVALDCGRQMFADIDGMPRFDRFLDAIVQLSYACQLQNDRLGLVAFDNSIRIYIPPRKRVSILKELYFLAPSHVESDFFQLFQFIRAHQRKRLLIIVFSEISDSLAGTVAISILNRLAQKSQVILVMIDDPEILALAGTAVESEERFFDNVASLLYLKQKADLCGRLSRAGIDVVRTYSEKLNVELVNRYLRQKALRRL